MIPPRRRGWTIGLCALGLGLVACESTKTSNTITGPFGQCTVIVFVNGTSQRISGEAGSTVTIGNTTYTFGPDCSVTEAPVVVPPVVVAP